MSNILFRKTGSLINSRSLLPVFIKTMASDISGGNGKKLIAVCQLNCKENKEDNYKAGERLIKEASSYGCSMAFLPECFDMICDSRKSTLANLEPLDGPIVTKYRELAKQCNIWLSLGGLHEQKKGNENGKASNAHLIINSSGDIVSVYRKAHLFNLEIPGVVRLVESEFSVAGDKVNQPVITPIGKVGLGICYDVRFPEFAISMAKAGADVLTYPSSFTVPTGSAHWETLLKARAIENQCYVVAAAQTGVHNAKRSSWGHSMVIDPWGAVIAQCGDGVGLAIALIDPQFHDQVRKKLPVWTDRRPDLYGEVLSPPEQVDIDSCESYTFGPVQIKSCQVFYRTRFSFAFVNHRPFLPGHSLVAPLRPSAVRLADLTAPEIADLFAVVQKVERALEREHDSSSSLIAIQDGADAGRSIEHLHVHILPRKPGDFDSDLIYADLAKHDKDPKALRTNEEMKEEANKMRKYFS